MPHRRSRFGPSRVGLKINSRTWLALSSCCFGCGKWNCVTSRRLGLTVAEGGVAAGCCCCRSRIRLEACGGDGSEGCGFCGRECRTGGSGSGRSGSGSGSARRILRK